MKHLFSILKVLVYAFLLFGILGIIVWEFLNLILL